jgi:hypothetical protein
VRVRQTQGNNRLPHDGPKHRPTRRHVGAAGDGEVGVNVRGYEPCQVTVIGVRS